MPLMKMSHDIDPRDELLKKFEPYTKDLQLTGCAVLVAIYKRPEKTKGGLILTDAYRDEDEFQGKVGLIIKMNNFTEFNLGCEYKVGDWVMFRASDGMPFLLGEKDGICRAFKDHRTILMKIPEPDIIW